MRRTLDKYYTPPWCVDALVNRLGLRLHGKQIMDPCCGDGSIIRALANHGLNATGFDIDPDGGWAHRGDALLDPWPWTVEGNAFRAVVTNPPYRHAEAFVRRALEETSTVAMLLRLGFMAGRGRRDMWSLAKADVLVLPRRPSFTCDGRTDASEYAWFVWEPWKDRGEWMRLEGGV